MNLLGLKIISLTGSSMCSRMVAYQKHSHSSEVFHKEIILGPTLFLIHLDDIDNCLRYSSIIKYADDTVIYVIAEMTQNRSRKN